MIRIEDHEECICGHMRYHHAPGIKGTDAASHCRDSYKASDGRHYPCLCDEFRRRPPQPAKEE